MDDDDDDDDDDVLLISFAFGSPDAEMNDAGH